jgi:uncharacterized membrane protein
MSHVPGTFRPLLVAAVAAAFLVAAGCSSTERSETAGKGKTVKVTLSGDNEVPAVKTKATGNGTITVGVDKSVSGKITTMGVDGTAAHIHDGAPGKNGPVIIPLTKSGNDWTVPAGAKLSDEQYRDFQAGNLYVNVHSAQNKGGEIRANLSAK